MRSHPKLRHPALILAGFSVLAACTAVPGGVPEAPLPPPQEHPSPEESPAPDRQAAPLADLESDLEYRVDLGVELDDRAGIQAPVLRARVAVTNISSGAVRLEHSGCSVMLEAHRPGGEDRPAVWRQARAASWPAGSPFGCPLPLIVRVLEPGESYDGGEGVGWFGTRLPVTYIYGDSLPAGRYAFAALLHVNGDSVRLSGGEAVLPPSSFLLGPEYPLDGFHYVASSAPVPDRRGSFEVRVAVRNAGLRPDLTRYLRSDCPVLLYAYATAAAQRAAPPEPVWRHPRDCGPGIEPMRLTTGEERVLTRRFTAREVLGDTLPPGRYHFTAIVRLGDGRGASRRTVWLDAGALELRSGTSP